MRSALALALALVTPTVAAQPSIGPCSDPSADPLRCFGYLFVGDGAARAPVTVDGRAAGPAPVLLQLEPLRAYTVRVGRRVRRVRVSPRRITVVELDGATAAARVNGSDEEVARLRRRVPLGYASVVQPDTCGGPWIIALDEALPLHPLRALELWEEFPVRVVRGLIPRAEELLAQTEAACRGGDATACEDAARATLALVDRVPGMTSARAEALWRFSCEVQRSAQNCDFLGRHLGGDAGEALLQRACAQGFAGSCSTLAIDREIRALQAPPARRPDDLDEARRLFARCCALGDASCCLARDRLRRAPP